MPAGGKLTEGFETTPTMVLPSWARIRLEEIDGELKELRALDEPPRGLIQALEQERQTIVQSRLP